jgi:hypothetical protein
MKPERNNPIHIPLQPFSENQRNGFAVECLLNRSDDHLSLLFSITGAVGELVIPDNQRLALRKDKLWCTTCFESFFKVNASPRYWELNVSPGGHWNLYRFSDYRKDMAEETAVSAITSRLSLENNLLSLSISLQISNLVAPEAKMMAGVCCVLESRNGEKHYWAITHLRNQPDFHHPGSMCRSMA